MSTKICTGKVRFSFCHVWEPRASENGGDPKYSVTLLIPKSDKATLNAIQQAMAEARENFCKRNGAASLPAKPKHTLYDGDGERPSGDPFGPECKGCMVITVSSKKRPMIVNKAKQTIIDQEEVYSGCYGAAVIDFYGYNSNGNKGISAELKGIMKLADGEPFGSVCTADDFADFGDDDDWM